MLFKNILLMWRPLICRVNPVLRKCNRHTCWDLPRFGLKIQKKKIANYIEGICLPPYLLFILWSEVKIYTHFDGERLTSVQRAKAGCVFLKIDIFHRFHSDSSTWTNFHGVSFPNKNVLSQKSDDEYEVTDQTVFPFAYEISAL
jgi:hypothetical protein